MSAPRRRQCLVNLPIARRVPVARHVMIVPCGMTVRCGMLARRALTEATAQNEARAQTAPFAMIVPFALSEATVETESSALAMTAIIGRHATTAPLAMIDALSCAASVHASIT